MNFDFEKAKRDLETHCSDNRIDLEALLEAGAKHFEGPLKKNVRLTKAELDALAKEDFDGCS